MKSKGPIPTEDVKRKWSSLAKDSTANTDMDGGTVTHELIEKAFKECEGDLERIPDWFVENLPNVRPDIQPQVNRPLPKKIKSVFALFQTRVSKRGEIWL